MPGEIARADVSIEPTAYRFKAGHRIGLDIVNGDSDVTKALWTHVYAPNKIGPDTVHHGPSSPPV